MNPVSTTRRDILRTIGPAAALALATPASAQDATWPTRTVRFVIPFAPGGPVEIPARFIAEHLTRSLGRTVIVETRPGAGGALGIQTVLQARDGHSFLFTTSSVAILPAMQRNPGYDPLHDLVPVTLISEAPMAFVARADWPVPDLAALLRIARGGSPPFTFASSGSGSTTHLAGELLKVRAGIDLTHIPYRGAGQAVGALLAGDTDLLVTGLIEAIPHVREGRMRAIAVTSAARSPGLPEVPALAEAVPGYELVIWYALLAPRGTPPAIVTRLADEIAPLRSGTVLAERMAEAGATLLLDGPVPLAARLTREVALWQQVLPAAGIRPE